MNCCLAFVLLLCCKSPAHLEWVNVYVDVYF
jgi:hypothetical protein